MSKAYNKKTTEFFNNPTASSHRVQFLHHEPHSKQLTKKSLTIECNIPHIERDVKQLRETDSTLTVTTPKNINSIQGNRMGFQIRQPQPDDFDVLKFLGNGKFGCVYLVRHKYTGFIFAMKIISKSCFQCESGEQQAKLINQLIRQIKIQSYLSHPNIISLYTFFDDAYKIYLIMELACHGQLYQLMKDGHKFKEQTVSLLMRQILQGLSVMHQARVIHRDIKPQNIVLIHGTPKICDFGWSVYCSKQFRSTFCGTPLYLSPQLLRGNVYNQKIDIWAVGTLAYELITGQNPFKISHQHEISKIITDKFVMETGSSSCRNFIDCALQKDPQKRNVAQAMLQHEFINKYQGLQISQELCLVVQQKCKQKQKHKRMKASILQIKQTAIYKEIRPAKSIQKRERMRTQPQQHNNEFQKESVLEIGHKWPQYYPY